MGGNVLLIQDILKIKPYIYTKINFSHFTGLYYLSFSLFFIYYNIYKYMNTISLIKYRLEAFRVYPEFQNRYNTLQVLCCIIRKTVNLYVIRNKTN